MAFSFGFFNAKNMDRIYTAEDFTGYLSSMVHNGIFDTYGDCFSLRPDGGLYITTGTGKAWIDGHYFINDANYKVDFSQFVDQSLNRYVIIGIYCDTSEAVRKCGFIYKASEAAKNPTIPTFNQTSAKKHLTLAAIHLKAGATEIKEADIIDYRSNENYCGYVRCMLGKCKLLEILESLNTFNETVDRLERQIDTLTNRILNLEEEMSDYTADILDEGNCGNGVNYILYSDGNLLIKGTGAMYDYDLYGKPESVLQSPFAANDRIVKAAIRNGVTTIGTNAFELCGGLTSITLTDTISCIGNRAFYNCIYLKNPEIPNKCTTIGEECFLGCSSIEEITIPSSVNHIGKMAFYFCESLKSAVVNSSVMGESMLAGCTALNACTIHTNVKKMGESIFIGCEMLDTIIYLGTTTQWKNIEKPDNWISSNVYYHNGYLKNIVCTDGAFIYDDNLHEWLESGV